jgi:kynureninase
VARRVRDLRPELIYLDGNSLGRTPKRTVAALHRVVEQWSNDLITSWWEHDWLNLTLTVGDELAPLLGAGPGECRGPRVDDGRIFQRSTPRSISFPADG